MISVVIPAYNQARYLLRAIESVWAQEIDDLEIVVVDDHGIAASLRATAN
ncbi:MAG: hypothetical protein DMF72_04295 [Acidobacteria bacterium]|nr:MAG: hypothetical protein DMF72_04295 [Acidobacteriota bacterium]